MHSRKPRISWRRRIPGFLYAATMAVLLMACGAEPGSQNSTAPELSTGQPLATQSAIPAQALVATVEYAGDPAKLPPTAKVFVFARIQGTTMPLAVESLLPADLPTQVGFARPGQDFTAVEVVARISLSGAVNKQAHDLEVISSAIGADQYAQNIRLLIPAAGQVGSRNTGEVSTGVEHSSNATSGAGVRLEIALGPDVIPAATARLFVIAKIPESPMPMPLAVKAIEVAELPVEIVLTDADSLSTFARLGNEARVQVVARLSQSGATQREPGDWESETVVVATDLNNTTSLTVEHLVD